MANDETHKKERQKRSWRQRRYLVAVFAFAIVICLRNDTFQEIQVLHIALNEMASSIDPMIKGAIAMLLVISGTGGGLFALLAVGWLVDRPRVR